MKAWSVSAENYKVSFEELNRIMRTNAQSKKTLRPITAGILRPITSVLLVKLESINY